MAVIKYNKMPDAQTQAQIKARGDTIQVVPPAGAPSANTGGQSITAPYQQGLTETGPKPGGGTLTQPINPQQYATPTAASSLATSYGGTVGGGQAVNGGPVKLPNSPLTVSTGGTPQNAGALAAYTNAYGGDQTASMLNSGLINAGRKTAAPVNYTPPAFHPATIPPQTTTTSTTSTVPNSSDITAPPIDRGGGARGGIGQDAITAPGRGGPANPYDTGTANLNRGVGAGSATQPPASTGGGITSPPQDIGTPPMVGSSTLGGTPATRYPVPPGYPTYQNPTGGWTPTNPPPPTYPSTPTGGTPPGTLPTYNPGTTSGAFPSIPGGYQSPVVTSGDQGDKYLADKIESDRQLALSQGQNLVNQFRDFSGQSAARSSALQGQLASAYAPLGAGQGGYTPDQISQIERTGQLEQLPTSAAALQSNYLSPQEQASITANPNAGVTAFQQGAQGMQGTLGQTGANVNQSLDAGASGVNQYLDPNALNLSPQAQQDIINQAANSARTTAQAQEQQLTNQAFSAGNVSPLALAAARDRASQTGELSAADAMTDARLRSEQARLAAAQAFAGLGTQNAQETAQRNTGAQLELGAQGLGAGQFLTSAGIGAAQTADTAASSRAAQEAQNRQAVNVANQGTQYSQGMDLNQLESGRAKTVADANVTAGQEYRNNYLGSQEQQANQNIATGGQQELGAFQTQLGAANQAGSSAIANKATNNTNPGSIPNLIFARGGVVRGPRIGLVGETFKPEAIVPIGPPKAQPHYGIPPASMGRTLTRSGFQRILPKFGDGGEIVPLDLGGGFDPYGDYPEGDQNSLPLSTGGPGISLASRPDLTVNDPGLTDRTTGPNSPLRRGIALAAMTALGRTKFGGFSGLLGDRISGANNSGTDQASKDAALAKEKAASARRTQASSGPTGPPPSPASDARNANFRGSILPEIMKYRPYEYNPENVLNGGGSNKPSTPSPTSPGKPAAPKMKEPPKQPAKPIDLGTPPVIAPPPPSIPTPRIARQRSPMPDQIPIEQAPSTIKFGAEVPNDPSNLPLNPGPSPITYGPDPNQYGSDSSVNFGHEVPGYNGGGSSAPPVAASPPPEDSGNSDLNYGGDVNYGEVGSGMGGGDAGTLPLPSSPDPTQYGPNVGSTGDNIYQFNGAPPLDSSMNGAPNPWDFTGSGGGTYGNTYDAYGSGNLSDSNPMAGNYQQYYTGIGDGGSGGGTGGYDYQSPMPDEMDGFARGGIIGTRGRRGKPPSRSKVFAPPQSPFGPTQIVSKPTLMPLGSDQPQAVVPLTPNPNARVKPSDIPNLIRRYGNR